ncbi:MAG: RNA polymerase sigma factor (sigma-70 family) [Sphingobacteriales bacterium]|jgi:RNA polymerase sigma factor (sigma-70 family)
MKERSEKEKLRESILVRKIKDGSQEAFSELFDRYSDALNGVLYKILNDTEAAEDALQECFMKIWRARESYQSNKGTLFTWMLNIARNTAIDKLRKKKSLSGYKIRSIDDSVGIDRFHKTETPINHIGLKENVGHLPRELKLIIDYVYFQGYTHKEVSEELEMPLGTVKTRVRNALRELRKVYVNASEV